VLGDALGYRVLLCVKSATIKGDPTSCRVTTRELILRIPIQEIELFVNAVGATVAAHSVNIVRSIVVFVGLADGLLVVVGRYSKAILDPTFQNCSLDEVGIDTPAAQESHVTVPNRPTRGLRFIRPLVQVELDRHVVVEELSPFALLIDFFQVFEEKPVSVLCALDDEGLRIVIESTRPEDPRRYLT